MKPTGVVVSEADLQSRRQGEGDDDTFFHITMLSKGSQYAMQGVLLNKVEEFA